MRGEPRPREGHDDDPHSRRRLDERTATEMVARTPHLTLRPGLRLVTYVHRDGLGDCSVTFALPTDAPAPPARDVLDRHGDPTPPGAALRDPMAAVAGDGSAASSVWASLLRREIAEIGASWHGLRWTHHRILGEPLPPAERAAQPGTGGPLDPEDPEWTWYVDPPEPWEPTVRTSADGSLAVTLHTYTDLERESIVAHTDVYRAGDDLVPITSERETLAEGPGGFIH